MRRTALVCFALIAATAAAALTCRPAWPVDETRYLGVAWGMWARGDFLVPRLNGVLYTDKPPLLFWLMHAGWAVFGVNDWWPRLIGPLSALLNLWLTSLLARRLFPADRAGDRHAAGLAPLLLCGSLLFAAWSSFLMFDMLLVSATLLALLGLLVARQDGGSRGWLLCAFGLGTGFLIKGPVLLVHVLPVAVGVRWWSPGAGAANATPATGAAHSAGDAAAAGAAGLLRTETRGGRWALRVVLALLLGVALALLWVIPAGISGGPAYRDALLYGQAAHRLANSGDVPHAQPWWFYLAMLPLLLLPWSVWPRMWRAVRATWRPATAPPALVRGVDGVRFALVWALPALLLLSAIGSKQEQYLLPELPAFALLGAALLARQGADGAARASAALEPPGAALAARRGEAALPGLLLGAVGVAMICAGRQWPPLADPDLAGTSATVGAVLAALGALLACARFRDATRAATALAGTCAVVLLAIHVGAPPGPVAQRDLRPAAARLAALEQAGRPLAYLGKYRAQYDFYGRLLVPLASLEQSELRSWFAQHADGVLVSTHPTLDRDQPELGLTSLAALPSGEWLWERAARNAPPVRSPGSR